MKKLLALSSLVLFFQGPTHADEALKNLSDFLDKNNINVYKKSLDKDVLNAQIADFSQPIINSMQLIQHAAQSNDQTATLSGLTNLYQFLDTLITGMDNYQINTEYFTVVRAIYTDDGLKAMISTLITLQENLGASFSEQEMIATDYINKLIFRTALAVYLDNLKTQIIDLAKGGIDYDIFSIEQRTTKINEDLKPLDSWPEAAAMIDFLVTTLSDTIFNDPHGLTGVLKNIPNYNQFINTSTKLMLALSDAMLSKTLSIQERFDKLTALETEVTAANNLIVTNDQAQALGAFDRAGILKIYSDTVDIFSKHKQEADFQAAQDELTKKEFERRNNELTSSYNEAKSSLDTFTALDTMKKINAVRPDRLGSYFDPKSIYRPVSINLENMIDSASTLIKRAADLGTIELEGNKEVLALGLDNLKKFFGEFFEKLDGYLTKNISTQGEFLHALALIYSSLTFGQETLFKVLANGIINFSQLGYSEEAQVFQTILNQLTYRTMLTVKLAIMLDLAKHPTLPEAQKYTSLTNELVDIPNKIAELNQPYQPFPMIPVDAFANLAAELDDILKIEPDLAGAPFFVFFIDLSKSPGADYLTTTIKLLLLLSPFENNPQQKADVDAMQSEIASINQKVLTDQAVKDLLTTWAKAYPQIVGIPLSTGLVIAFKKITGIPIPAAPAPEPMTQQQLLENLNQLSIELAALNAKIS